MVRTIDTGMIEMIFPEFLELLARVADRKWQQVDTSHSSPDLPLSEKLTQLFQIAWPPKNTATAGGAGNNAQSSNSKR
jgi:hypothetical protein